MYIYIYICMYEPQVREVQEMQALRERELRLESQVSADLRRRLAAADDANTALEAELASAKAALEADKAAAVAECVRLAAALDAKGV